MNASLNVALDPPRRAGPVSLVRRLVARLNLLPNDVISLVARIGVVGIFWRSGQTKVDGFTVTDGALYLFQEEYNLPLIPPEVAAHMAALAEHLLPALLVIGLASRFSAAGLLAMTITIQIFVYPGSWPDHFTWAAALLFLIARGPGALSLDHLIGRLAGGR
ncbi:MAG: DoxX family protein [Rhodobacterales bacterium]|nr:DoxX family protein [Rhodobacterales bacterium]